MLAVLALTLAASAATPACGNLPTAIARDECLLAESLKQAPNAACDDRMTQVDMNVCSHRDYLRADIEMSRTWLAVADQYGGKAAKREDPLFAQMQKAHRSWLTYREDQCEIFSQMFEGGSIRPLVVNTCLTEITVARNRELMAMLEGMG